MLVFFLVLGIVIIFVLMSWWMTGSPPPKAQQAPSSLAQRKNPLPARTTPHESFHVVSSHWNEDVKWLKESGLSYSICDKTGNPNYEGTADCPDVPKNKGRECSAYLSYIISNYDSLPDQIAFVHGHEFAWHQQNGSMKDVLLLARDRLREEMNYTSLNDMTLCLWRNCPRRKDLMVDEAKRQKVMPFWDDVIAPVLREEGKWPSRDCRSAWNDCCAQFVTTRELIHRFPKAAYQRIFDDLMNLPNDVEICFALETVWHAIVGREELCAQWDRDCPISHTIGARLQGEPNSLQCLTGKRP